MPSPNKKRLIQNLVLLIAVAGLIAFVATRTEESGAEYATLYDKAIGDEATRLMIHSEGHDDVVIKNDNDVWKVTKPKEFIADQQKVRQLFTLLSENAESSYDIEGKDLASYGLDKDRLSVSFNGVKILFGNYNEVSMKRYVLKGNKMYLISETVSGLMKTGAEGFIKQAE